MKLSTLQYTVESSAINIVADSQRHLQCLWSCGTSLSAPRMLRMECHNSYKHGQSILTILVYSAEIRVTYIVQSNLPRTSTLTVILVVPCVFVAVHLYEPPSSLSTCSEYTVPLGNTSK